MIRLLNYLRKYLHKTPVNTPSPPSCNPCLCFDSPASKNPCFPMAVNQSPPLAALNTNRDPPATPSKVKFLLSIGGKIMPRLRDGDLHYVGGQTRVMAFRRDTNLHEFYRKLQDVYGDPIGICYQLPDQNLEALVSVSSVEDFDNMMNLCDWLSAVSGYGFTKLRVFLFPLSNTNTGNSATEDNDTTSGGGGLRFTESVIGVNASAASRNINSKDSVENSTILPNSNTGNDGFIREGMVNISASCSDRLNCNASEADSRRRHSTEKATSLLNSKSRSRSQNPARSLSTRDPAASDQSATDHLFIELYLYSHL